MLKPPPSCQQNTPTSAAHRKRASGGMSKPQPSCLEAPELAPRTAPRVALEPPLEARSRTFTFMGILSGNPG